MSDTGNEFAGYCTACMKSISCSNSGANQLISHTDGQKHKKNMKYMHDNSQKRLFGSAPKTISSQGGGDKSICVQVHTSHKEQVQKAAILCALKVASSGYPYRTCDGTPALYQAVFPGLVSKDFVLCIPTFEGKVSTFFLLFLQK
ncbi:hypothetical protein DPMN_113735 [Dreissena polymorpha]|uniref:Uncharacterized protein n=1 Tax=Dreissena polymorpha TaxID=45954 RepID=A0A9D4KIS3_DREPO|nr:hypothetical protein DPMN_113735 [Dreissena polymorpha]